MSFSGFYWFNLIALVLFGSHGGQHQLIDFYSFGSKRQTIDSTTLTEREINPNITQKKNNPITKES